MEKHLMSCLRFIDDNNSITILQANSSSMSTAPSTSSQLNQQLPDGFQFHCHSCPSTFKTRNSLHNHLAIHSDMRLFVCLQCGHSFKTSKDLSRHVATHDNKHKTCHLCAMTFKTAFHLKRHSLTRHTNMRPFRCMQCGMTFARKDKLKQHSAKHVEYPLYECKYPQCGKGFYRKEHLKDHEISRHSKQYPFMCEHCNKGFVHAKDLHRHIRVRHLGARANATATTTTTTTAIPSDIIQLTPLSTIMSTEITPTTHTTNNKKPKATKTTKAAQSNYFEKVST
jgi:uncharacterized C2H2 Zn-finger protein